MVEQSVLLSRLIILYFISTFLLYAPILPNREPKTNAFPSIFVLEQFFSSSVVVSVAKATTPNIVGYYMLSPFAHPVACCWELLLKA